MMSWVCAGNTTVLSSFVVNVLFSCMSAAVVMWLYVMARLVHTTIWWSTIPDTAMLASKAASNTDHSWLFSIPKRLFKLRNVWGQ